MEILAVTLSLMALLVVGPLMVILYFKYREYLNTNKEMNKQIQDLVNDLNQVKNQTDLERIKAVEQKVAGLMLRQRN